MPKFNGPEKPPEITVLSPERHNAETDLAESKKENARLKEELATWKRAALEDFPTGALNRRGLELMFKDRAGKAKSATVLIMDLDKFKLVNDTYGHRAGDDVIKKAVEMLKESVRDENVAEGRPGDLVARIGGEELVALFFDAAPEDIIEKFDKLPKQTNILKFSIEIDGKQIDITASGGIAQVDGSRKEDLWEAIDRADKEGLYPAKMSGRNTIVNVDAPKNADETG